MLRLAASVPPRSQKNSKPVLIAASPRILPRRERSSPVLLVYSASFLVYAPTETSAEYSQACQAGGANVGNLSVSAAGSATTSAVTATTPVILTSSSVSVETTVPAIVTTTPLTTTPAATVTTSAAAVTSLVASVLPSVTASASGAGQVKVVGAGVLGAVVAAVAALL